MKRVRRGGTEAELRVRRLLYRQGARFRVNVRNLPGSPDIVNQSKGKAIFVHGCFWHYHAGCPRGRIPKRNVDFWRAKLEGNRKRDVQKEEALLARGFDILTVWECELTDEDKLRRRLDQFWFG